MLYKKTNTLSIGCHKLLGQTLKIDTHINIQKRRLPDMELMCDRDPLIHVDSLINTYRLKLS